MKSWFLVQQTAAKGYLHLLVLTINVLFVDPIVYEQVSWMEQHVIQEQVKELYVFQVPA